MSALGKTWKILNKSDKSTFEKLLENRRFDPASELNDFYDPFLFTDMEKACRRIEQAISKKERIIIFGDYDVDGISGTALLVHTMKLLQANCSYRLPNRTTDGYGLSDKFIHEFIEKEIKLLITVDCGISCNSQIQLANENDIDVIVTDHHTIPENAPAAFAIIHPKIDSNYPFKELTGSGVALKLAHALIDRNLPTEQKSNFLESLLDLASLGTVADLGPLTGENRLIVRRGLEKLKNTSWPGLKQIKNSAGIKDEIGTVQIGYHIAPRINAAGRIGDPYLALSLLLQENGSEKIAALGQKLEDLNQERQEMTRQAIFQLEDLYKNEKMPSLIVENHPEWHVGIIGLVAGRIVEKYGRPAIIMQDLGDTLVASARSPRSFNIVEAITAHSEHLISFGGHAQAAGFNMKKKNYTNFKNAIQKYAKKNIQEKDMKAILEIDCEIKQQELTLEFIEELDLLKPFGIANEKPTFLLRNVEPLFISNVGKEKTHLKFTTRFGEKSIQSIAFRMGEFADLMRKNRRIDLVFQLEKNTWQGRSSLQMIALDFKTHAE